MWNDLGIELKMRSSFKSALTLSGTAIVLSLS